MIQVQNVKWCVKQSSLWSSPIKELDKHQISKSVIVRVKNATVGWQNLGMEFSLNVFTEFAEFSDKKIKIKMANCRIGTQDLLCKRQRLIPLSHWDRYNWADPYIEPQFMPQWFLGFSEFSEFSELNSIKVLLHSEKTPMIWWEMMNFVEKLDWRLICFIKRARHRFSMNIWSFSMYLSSKEIFTTHSYPLHWPFILSLNTRLSHNDVNRVFHVVSSGGNFLAEFILLFPT